MEKKILQTQLPVDLHKEFKSVVYSNGEKIQDVVEKLVADYVANVKK